MPSDYSIKKLGEITEISLYQNLNLQKMYTLWDEILASFPSEKRLWDLTSYTGDFSRDEIIQFAEYSKHSMKVDNWAAMVAPTNLLFGEMRQYKVYREHDSYVTVGVFRTRDQALDWLASVTRANPDMSFI